MVGGSLPEDANVIAEVDGDGVAIAANANTVMGNRLGLPYGGGLGNHANGVSVTGNDNRIGKTSAGGRNVISANNDHGVLISGNGNAVEGNYVGLDENGASGPGNIWTASTSSATRTWSAGTRRATTAPASRSTARATA